MATTPRTVRKPRASLADAYPEIAMQWHPHLNDRTPEDVVPGSTYMATWHDCPVDARHIWRGQVRLRTTRGAGCAVCAGKQLMPGVTDLATLRPDLAEQWHPTLNERRPDEVSPGSHYLATWHNCPADSRHVWQSQVNSRSKANRPYGCAVCSGKQVMPGISDLATTHPHIAAQWHPTLNDRTPEQVGPGSAYRAYWTNCPVDAGHVWRSAVGGRTNARTGCSVCAGQLVQPGFNDLASKHPHLARQWHPTKNAKPPTAYTGTSGFKAWWLCTKGHEWRASIASRSTGFQVGCPECSIGSSSKPEILVRSLIQASRVVEVLSHKPVKVPVAWSGRKHMSVDVLGKIGEEMVVVEYDGAYYHGSENAFARDRTKTLALLKANYLVVRLRENSLPHLQVEHPRLLQTNFPARPLTESRAEAQLVPVLKWLSKPDSKA